MAALRPTGIRGAGRRQGREVAHMDVQQRDGGLMAAHCASCGAPLRADAAVCGSCGRAVAHPVAMDAPTVPAMTPVTPPDALHTTWPAMPPASHGPLAGIASLAATPVAPPAARRPRAGLMATVAALTLLAVLGGGAYWVFANFIHTASQTDTARYVPDTAVAFASVDLVSLSTNSHHFNLNDTLAQSSVTQAMKQSVGLDWQTDIQPWVGRIVSVAAFPSLSGGTTTGSAVGSAPLSVVVILQSRDDGAATSAIDKALAAHSGATYAHGTYDSFTQRSAAGDAATFEIGSGLVVFSTTQAGAHMVVDRVNGHGATLAGNSDFIRAVSDLPSDRYGTLYVGLSAVVDPLGTGGSGVHIPLLDTYPTIAGSLAWTDDGMRAVTNLKPVRSGVPSVPLNGDTTGLAALVPADASVYAGAAKGGPLANEFARLIATGTQTNDPVQSTLGVDATDPALAQPAALFLTTTSGDARSGALLLRAPDAGAASALIAKVATHNSWTSRAITVGGTSATEYATTEGGQVHAVAVSLMVQGTLVLADSAATAQAVLATASGGASLAHAANFQRLVAHGPSAHAVTVYVDAETLTQALGARGTASGSASSTPLAGLKASASLLTLEWSSDQLRLTGDSLLAS
jgi:hypothetical protein